MLQDELKNLIKGDVLADETSLAKYSRDYSVFKVPPKVVVFPKDTDDVKNLVKFAVKKKTAGESVSLTGRSAGTDMTGGPLNQSVIVSFTPPSESGQTPYFNHIKNIEENPAGGGGIVTVEPGVYFRDLEKELAKRGLLYPPYPASKDLCALGGMISNNSGGEKTLAYGKTEDYVEELTMVMAEGEAHVFRAMNAAELREKIKEDSFEGNLFRSLYDLIEKNKDAIAAAKPDVSKNSAGYFLWNVWDGTTFNIIKLLVGSQGTLGLVTEAKLRLVKAKKYNKLGVIFLPTLSLASDLVVELLKLKPESIESYDDKTLHVALKFLPGIIRSMKGSFVKLLFQFIPEAVMALRGGMPKMVLLVEVMSDDEADALSRLHAVGDVAKRFKFQHRLLKNDFQQEKYWTIRRQSFALLHNHSTGLDTAPFIDDVIVRPQYLHEFLPQVNAILDKYKKDLAYTIAGHPGDGNFHIIPLMNLKDPRIRALIPKISEEVYRLVFKYKGSITAEHNDGLIRTPYLEEMYGAPVAALFAEVKNIFDPLGIFNPGKKVGGSFDYSVEHISAGGAK